MGAWGAMMLGLKHPQLFGAVGAFSAPFGHFETGPEYGHDVTNAATLRCTRNTRASRAGTPGRWHRRFQSGPFHLLFLACGNQDIFVADNRRFVERLTARKIPVRIPRAVSAWAYRGEVWDGQVVSYCGRGCRSAGA
jgi:esterase/lipase superfamily enzyme